MILIVQVNILGLSFSSDDEIIHFNINLGIDVIHLIDEIHHIDEIHKFDEIHHIDEILCIDEVQYLDETYHFVEILTLYSLA